MPEKTRTQIPRDIREAYEKGLAAFQRNNFDYALASLMQAVTREPAYYEAREALRAAQFKKAGGGGGLFKKMLGGVSSSPLVAKAQMTVRNNPIEAINICEQVLGADPNNASAHKILAEAAIAADLPKTAALSLKILLKSAPRDRDFTMQLGEALAAAGQINEAETVLSELLRTRPTDGELGQLLKDITARRTLSEGGYEKVTEEGGSYRDILRNKEEAVSLEQEKREVKSGDVAAKLIVENEARIAREPDNLKLLRDTAELFVQQQNYDQALAYYNRLNDATGGAEASLERIINEITLKRFDAISAQLDPANPEHAAQLDQLRLDRANFVITDTQRRAEKYPTDLDIRFELARLYFDSGRVGEAIQEFQKAQNNPHRRFTAMGYLAQCFAKRGMNDLAARKFQEAIKEKQAFDDEKKDLIYHLGTVLEKMGKADEAIEQFKLIYEVDIGYRDVQAKVDSSYGGH